VVGPLQPILARLPGQIERSVLDARNADVQARSAVVDSIVREVDECERAGFDIDTMTDGGFNMPEQARPIITMEDMDRVIASSDLMPAGYRIEPMGERAYKLLAPDMKQQLRVTTSLEYFDQHPESVELWSPGNPLFDSMSVRAPADPVPKEKTLKEILDTGGVAG